jgi:hypothetical protein
VNQIPLDSTVLETLKNLGSTLRMEKFLLRATIKKKNEFQNQENEIKSRIRGLYNKISWELDHSSKISKDLNKDEE